VASLVWGGVTLASPAAATTIEACDTTVDDRPVVLTVHGLSGEPDDFTKEGPNGTMNQAIESISQVNRVRAFDYHGFSLKWVTDEHLGAALANQIDCLSDASLQAGGNGKIVVANSLGGLVLRQALNQNAAVHTSPDKLGLAIMIGSPNQGTWAAVLGKAIYRECSGTFPFQRCRPSPAARALVPPSSELDELPQMPETVPLRAIALDIVIGRAHFGDMVVSVDSATAESTTQYPGDGMFVIRCASLHSLCTHNALLRNAQVQTKVTQAFAEYVLSLPEAEPTPTCEPNPEPSEPEGAIGGVGVGVGSTETPCP
jgi:hypothetical protein